MNKTELIEKIAAGSGLKKAEAKDALDATLRELKNALVAGEVNERPERQGVNPATGAKIVIPARKVVKFKAGADLSDAVNA